MLQISSGKMFTKDVEYRNNLRGIIYTNLFFIGGGDIKTKAGNIFSTSHYQLKPNTLVYEIEENIESIDDSDQPGIIAQNSIAPYILDFCSILSFSMNCTASPSREVVERLLIEAPGVSTFTIPKHVVKRTFDKDIFLNDIDKEKFERLSNHLIGLERQSYLKIMRAIRTYVTGIQRVSDDFELAYTLLVASIESLAQDFYKHENKWSDYNKEIKSKLEEVLNTIEEEKSIRIKDLLLKNEHMAIGKRFKEFVKDNIDPSFYREDAAGLINPISNVDLPNAINNAYTARSEYIHKLKKLPYLSSPVVMYSETVKIENSIWLTIQGLSRLVRHVITEFVFKLPTIEKENYDYSNEKYNIIIGKADPKYYIGNITDLKGNGNKILEALLQQIVQSYIKNKSVITDLRILLKDFLKKINNLNNIDKISYKLIYIIFICLAENNNEIKIKDKYFDEFESEILLKINIHSMIYCSLISYESKWELSSHDNCLKNYLEKRHHKNTIQIPTIIESAMILHIAERYRLENDFEKCLEWISVAVENLPGNSIIMDLEMKFINRNFEKIIWSEIMFPKK